MKRHIFALGPAGWNGNTLASGSNSNFKARGSRRLTWTLAIMRKIEREKGDRDRHEVMVGLRIFSPIVWVYVKTAA